MPDVTVDISISVPALPDNAVWFANSAAWSNYWGQVGFQVVMPVASVLNYGVVKQANTTVYAAPTLAALQTVTMQLDLDGSGNLTDFILPKATSVQEMKTAVEALIANYATMRTAMIAAGLINN